jgi:hypothetical protein
MLPSWCNDSVTVIRAPMVSVRGTKERDWSRAERHVVAGCSVQPIATSTNRNEPRNAVSATMRLLAPPNSDIEAGDRIEFGGGTYSVDGIPPSWRSPFGGCDHMDVTITEWRG